MTNADGIVEVNKTVPAATVFNLPAHSAVTPFKVFTAKDGAGNCATYNITLTPASGNIEGAASFAMNTDRMSMDFYSNGTEWKFV